MNTRDPFVHLHVHSDKSILDGAGKPRSYAERAAQLGQPSLGLTDHGNLNASMAHWKACTAAGIKPIIGCELYVAPEAADLKAKVSWGPGDPGRVAEDGDSPGISGGGAYTHLTAIAASPAGLRNLYRLQAESFDRGFYRKPRVDLQLLEAHSEGLIVLSGCAGSAISTRLRLGHYDEAAILAGQYKEIFGERFFVEVMHHGIPFEDSLNRDLLDLAHRHSIKVVATNDAHYCDAADSFAHSALLCVQTQSTMAKPVFQFSGSGYHIASRAEMERKPLPREALDNTLLISDMIGSYDSVFERRIRFPRVDLPDGWDEDEVLWALSQEGLEARIPNPTERHWEQRHYECQVICRMGYPSYFIALHDILREARRRGIAIGPGRGSAAGSLVAYALGITDLDPIVHGLIFERFLNPERASLPDIDIDVAEDRRDEFVQLVREMYGDEFMAQIGTFGSIGAKNALKDANRVLGGEAKRGDWYASQLPPAKFGRPPGIDEYTGPKDEVYDLARGLYGTTRSEGIHAAAVVISPSPLRELLPLRRPSGDSSKPWVTGLDMHEVERLGLVKMDFLGLRNLGIIDECLRMLVDRGVQWAPPVLPQECNDPATYELLSRGDTLGVFQLDGSGMRGLLRQLRPTRFDDVSAVLALYRPGPMGANAHLEFAKRKNSGTEWKPEWAIHPELEDALKPALAPSYGLIVWQEQVLEVLKIVCGWSYSEAALLFDAMRKKNHEKMEASRPSYEAAGTSRGYSPEAMGALWDILVPFADYSFNRAHSAAYGLIAYWTAYLKANHPREYMAAVLSSVAENPDKLPEYLEEVNRMGIPLLPPDINHSGVGFSPSPRGIHYGMSAIKGVGKAVFDAVAAKRPYASVDDFFRRVPVKALNSGSLGALVASGTLDGLTPYREELWVAREALSARALRDRQERRNGQRPLYRLTYDVGDTNLRSTQQRQEWERQYLSTAMTARRIELHPQVPLGEGELIWLRSLLARYPGPDEVRLILGRVSVPLPAVRWEAVRPAIDEIDIFEVIW